MDRARRLKSLEQRLDAIVKESKRLRAQVALLTDRSPTRNRQQVPATASFNLSYNPDDPVN
jgi:hypothetical protein